MRSSPVRRLALVGALLVAAAIAGIAAVAAFGGAGAPPPPSRSPRRSGRRDGAAPAGVTARVTFSNHLLPSRRPRAPAAPARRSSAARAASGGRTAAAGSSSSPRRRHADRVEPEAGDDLGQPRRTPSTGSHCPPRPAHRSTTEDAADGRRDRVVPRAARRAGERLGGRADRVAGRPAYSRTVAPKHVRGSSAARVAWDAETGAPLLVAVYGRGETSPVLELKVTDVAYGAVSRLRRRGGAARGREGRRRAAPDGGSKSRAARREKAGDRVARRGAARRCRSAWPRRDTLAGHARTAVRLLGGDSGAARLRDGRRGRRRRERCRGPPQALPPLDALPRVTVGGIAATELATPLGTVLRFEHGASGSSSPARCRRRRRKARRPGSLR